jgi:hypothetical protein
VLPALCNATEKDIYQNAQLERLTAKNVLLSHGTLSHVRVRLARAPHRRDLWVVPPVLELETPRLGKPGIATRLEVVDC